jgi:hypothetical protein
MADGDIEKQSFPFKLSPEEVDQRKNRLVKVEGEIDEEVDAKRAEMADRNSTLKELRKDRKGLLVACQTGTEQREVDVKEEWDFKVNMVRWRRMDTEQIIKERAMSGTERQEQMFEPNGNGEARRQPKLNTEKKAKGKRGKNSEATA